MDDIIFVCVHCRGIFSIPIDVLKNGVVVNCPHCGIHIFETKKR